MITDFSSLLTLTREQDEPQRLLFLFAKAEGQPKDEHEFDHSGTIEPVMCVDKLPEELGSFQALVAEADEINKEWNFVIIAGLSGFEGLPPTTEMAEPYLNQMANAVMLGGDLSNYIIFDRNETLVVVGAAGE